MPLYLTGHGITDIGCLRARNEDAFLIREKPALLAVADGMGGHDAGDLASETLVTMLGRVRQAETVHALADDAQACIGLANGLLLDEARARGGDVIGSTIVCVVAKDREASVLWSGDSRAYLMRGDDLTPLTEDHNAAQELVAAGALTRDAARTHRLASRITRAVGLDPGMVPERRDLSLKADDRLLLCSDGLTGCLADHEIALLLSGRDDRQACNALLEAAVGKGAPDNVTVICASVRQ